MLIRSEITKVKIQHLFFRYREIFNFIVGVFISGLLRMDMRSVGVSIMANDLQQILSVSRRTDIPAFYMPWFMDRVSRGMIEVVNPFNRQVRRVSLSPRRIHSMVFWSKNFGPFLAHSHGERLQEMGYHLFFNFTVNSRSPILEPGVPDLDQRIDQLRQLCRRFGAESVQWRFDPICHFTMHNGLAENNLRDFDTIASVASDCGIGTCITSFMDHYSKIQKRVSAKPEFTFVDPPLDTKVDLILQMEKELTARGIRLLTCCEKELVSVLPASSAVTHSACVPNELLLGLFGAVALIITISGITGVIATSVNQRTQEFGIRMALGAAGSEVRGLVLRQATLMIGLGIGVGLVAAFMLSRVIENQLFGVSARDPLTFAGVAVLLSAVAFAASYLPARRATSVDPIVALRNE